mgnify:FL=1|jgi:hypothetical protein
MKLNNLFYFFLASVLFISCEEEFLTEYPTSFITPDQIAAASAVNPDLQGGTVAGIYENIYKSGTGGTSNHDDFGQRGWDIATDMLSGDMVLGAKIYGWYSGYSELTFTVDYTSTRNYMPWRYYFRIVNLSNIVIEGLGGRDNVPDSDTGKHFLGQALTTRAYAYFYLTQLYQDGYDPSEPILPLYPDTKTPNVAKSTAAEVFAFIEADCQAAKSLLSNYTRSSVSSADKYVASTVLAYAYGAQGKWAEAAAESAIVVLDSGYRVVNRDEAVYSGGGDPVGGFNSVYNYSNSILWGTDLTTDSNMGLVSFWGKVDYYSYSYAAAGDGKIMDRGLYAQMRSDDVRAGQFLNLPGHPVDMYPLYKFYHEDRVFFGQRTVTADYFYFRYADMVLMHAEAQANLGNDAAAISTLEILLSERLDDTSYLAALSGQDLIDEIYLQTRLESWGEGKSYLAMKRNKATITRGPNWIDFAGDSFSYDDDKLSFEIPEAEIRDNPFINDQNE